jgi:PAS domain-containing protein
MEHPGCKNLQGSGVFLYLNRMKTWWDSVSNPAQWLHLLEDLPSVYFYAKDLNHRFMRANRAMADWHGCQSPAEMIGRCDLDFHTPVLAAQYVEEDLEVFGSGEPIKDRIWLVPGADGLPRWFLSSKFPLRDKAGSLAGLAGIARVRQIREHHDREQAEDRHHDEQFDERHPATVVEVRTGHGVTS